jgi:hypothetical protein
VFPDPKLQILWRPTYLISGDSPSNFVRFLPVFSYGTKFPGSRPLVSAMLGALDEISRD